MPSLIPFRGFRYDPSHVGALANVIAPPWDSISPELQTNLYERHPANVVRLERNRDEPGDDQHGNRHTRAARFLRAWREQGVLVQDPAAAIYVCHQEFEADGESFLRQGIVARVRLERFGTGNIHAHLEIDPVQKQDRLALLRSCAANTSPVVGLYPDGAGEVQAALETAVAGQPPVEARDDLGVYHRLWAVADQTIAARVAGLIGPRPVYIAAGHHRYEAACDYRDQLAAAWPVEHCGQSLPSDHPARFILMLVCGLDDTGLLPSADLLEAIQQVRETGVLRPAGSTALIPPAPAGLVINLLE